MALNTSLAVMLKKPKRSADFADITLLICYSCQCSMLLVTSIQNAVMGMSCGQQHLSMHALQVMIVLTHHTAMLLTVT